jgi:hypothetical protein
MTRVLIIGHSYDIHVSAVAWLLRRRGHHAVVWRMDQFPIAQNANLSIGPDGDSVGVEEALGHGERFDVVWRRRAVKPRVRPDLHASDHVVAERESRLFLENALGIVAGDARWVNPVAGRQRAVSKAVQLREARAVGLEIPYTLMSNSPTEIAAFVERHGGDVIVKPFFPAVWKSDSAMHHFFARQFHPALLHEHFALSAAPAIYQALVEKDHELRITVMGAKCFAARIDAPRDRDRIALDWKEDLYRRDVTACELPLALRDACLGLMRRLGIVFGCIDVICRPDGGYTFLEVNEMGAFLWVEEWDPAMHLLGAFCDFLCDPDADMKPVTDSLGIFDFRESEAFAAFEAEDSGDVLAHQYQMTMTE